MQLLSIKNKLFLAGISILSATFSLSAQACTYVPGFGSNAGEDIDFGAIHVDPNAAVGSIVATKTSDLIGRRPIFIDGCTNPYFRTQDWNSPGLPSVNFAGEILFQSGVAGYAFRIVTPGAGSTIGQFGAGPFPRRVPTHLPCSGDLVRWSYCGDSWGNVTFQLVKISDITGAGPLTNGTLIRASIVNLSSVYIATLTGSSIAALPTCSVTIPSINLSAGQVTLNAFSGVGSTSPAGRQENLSLQCAGGAAGDSTNVHVTLSDPGNLANRSDTLPLLQSSTAAGVGVQILHNGNVVSYGPDSAAVNNPNQFLAGAAGNGTFNIPLSARYIQTGPSVTQGTANATATFTMSYQ